MKMAKVENLDNTKKMQRCGTTGTHAHFCGTHNGTATLKGHFDNF